MTDPVISRGAERTLGEVVRERAIETGLYSVDLRPFDGIDVEALEQIWFDREVLSVPDWGAGNVVDIIADDAETVTERTVSAPVSFPHAGTTLSWKTLRDAIARHAGEEPTDPGSRSDLLAGTAVSFVDGIEEGTPVLVGLNGGWRCCITSGECRYEREYWPTGEYGHFVRSVGWARRPDGEPLAVPQRSLPESFADQPGVKRITEWEQLVPLADLVGFLCSPRSRDPS